MAEKSHHLEARDKKRHRSREKKTNDQVIEEHNRGKTAKKTTNITDDTIALHPYSRPAVVKKSEEKKDVRSKKTTAVRRVKSMEKKETSKEKDGMKKRNKEDSEKSRQRAENVAEQQRGISRHRSRETEKAEEKLQSKEENVQLNEKSRHHKHAGKLSKQIPSHQTIKSHCCVREQSDKTSKQKHEVKKEEKSEGTQKNKEIKVKEKQQCKHEQRKRERHHYSDSEIEQNRTTTRIYDIREKSGDSSAFCDLFTRNDSTTEHEQKQIRRSSYSKKKQPQRNSGDNSTEEQSNIRNKLIKVLFKRVKELLKETEQLREERKSLTRKITSLTEEVQILKLNKEEQTTQGYTIKERMDALSDGVNITGTGRTLKEEIHGILHEIQRKYASHWQEHEKKIQQMQSHAENEIQSLMESIMGKYVQINKLKNRACATSDLFLENPLLSRVGLGIRENEQDSQYTKPLFIDTSPLEENRPHYLQRDNRDLLLKVTEPRRCSSNITSALTSFDKMEPSVPRLFHQWNQTTNENVLHENPTSPSKETTAKSNNKHSFSLIPKKVAAKKDENSSREDLKEFWRHRLLQPNPSETLQQEKKGKTDGTMRNQF